MKTSKTFAYSIFAVIISLAFTACEQPDNPAHVHKWGEYVETTAPTCTTVGKETRTCTLDATHKETRDIAIDPTMHNWNEWGTSIAATETEDSFKTRTCKYDNSHTDTEFSGEYATGTTGLAFELISGGINDGTYRVRKGTVTEGEVHIPAYHRSDSDSEYLPITEIGSTTDGLTAGAFLSTSITAVHIPASVTTIGNRAFTFCTNLTSFIIPASVTAIGNVAFSSWTASQKIIIHDFADQTAADAAWGSNWRNNCNAVIIYGHVWGEWDVATAPTCTATGIGTRTCNICVAIDTNTTIPAIGHDYNWTVTTAPSETVDGTEAGVCRHDASHTTTRIAYATGTTGLAFEAIGNPATAYRVRKGTVTEGEVHIPAYHHPDTNSEYLPVTEIGSATDSWNTGAFYNTSLTSINIPEGVTIIGYGAFTDCINIINISIPASVMSIGIYAFYGCTSLTSVTFAEGSRLETIGNTAFYECKILTSIIIPEGVTSIGNSAFNYCFNLASITIPEGVISIGTYAFQACGSLTVVTIPKSVTFVDGGAFNSWNSSQTIYIAGSTSGWGNWRWACSAKVYQWNEGTQDWDEI